MKIGKYRLVFNGKGWFIPLLILIYTVNYYAETVRLPHPEVHNLLIRPVVYAIAVLSALYFITHLRREPAGEDGPEEPAAKSPPVRQAIRENRKFLLFLLQTAIYLPLISLLGFVPASALYMVVTMLQLGVRNVKVLVLLPLITVVGLVLMFETWLTITIPKGIFGF